MLTTHRYGEVEWVDVVDPTEEDLWSVAAKYGLMDRTFEEANRRAQRPTL